MTEGRGETVPAKNIHHDAVIAALTQDGWTITDDPLRLTFGGRDLFVDLGAEQRTIGAEKEGMRIAVEIQSFLSPSPVRDLQEAVGQYDVYRTLLAEMASDRQLYMAVPPHVHEGILREPLGQLLIARLNLRILVFDDLQRTVIRWIN